MHVCLHCGHVSWWFITGNKTHRQIILWREAGESSVCRARAGVRSTFSATINERSHAKFTFSLLLGPSIRQAQVSLACSLTASKANRQKSKPNWQTVFVTLHHNMGTKTQWLGHQEGALTSWWAWFATWFAMLAHIFTFATPSSCLKRGLFVSSRQILLLNHKLHRAVVLKSALAAWNVKIMLKIIKFNSYFIFNFIFHFSYEYFSHVFLCTRLSSHIINYSTASRSLDVYKHMLILLYFHFK